MLTGFFIIYSAPFSPNYSLYVIFGNVLFWLSLVTFVFKTGLKQVFNCLSSNMNKKGHVIYGIYLSFHYIV